MIVDQQSAMSLHSFTVVQPESLLKKQTLGQSSDQQSPNKYLWFDPINYGNTLIQQER